MTISRPYTIAFIKILEEDDKRRILAQETGQLPSQEQIVAPMVQIGLVPKGGDIQVDWNQQKVVKMPTGTRVLTLKLGDLWPNIKPFIEPNDKWGAIFGGDLGQIEVDEMGEPKSPQLRDGPIMLDFDEP